MVGVDKPFNTNYFFSGGAGMFLQYHDVVKPIFLYAIIQMILTNQNHGLPISIIKDMSIASLIEWYVNRRFINPLKQLDYNNIYREDVMDELMQQILDSDPSIYKLCPLLNIGNMMNVYKQQRMEFPIYVWTPYESKHVKEDCDITFNGIDHRYIFGDLKECIEKCNQNFTYIFSNIEMVKKSAEILVGTCSHILLAGDYRYNFVDYRKTLKYDLQDIMAEYPFVRIGLTRVMDPKEVVASYAKLIIPD